MACENPTRWQSLKPQIPTIRQRSSSQSSKTCKFLRYDTRMGSFVFSIVFFQDANRVNILKYTHEPPGSDDLTLYIVQSQNNFSGLNLKEQLLRAWPSPSMRFFIFLLCIVGTFLQVAADKDAAPYQGRLDLHRTTLVVSLGRTCLLTSCRNSSSTPGKPTRWIFRRPRPPPPGHGP